MRRVRPTISSRSHKMAAASGSQPSFFSQTMRGLGDTFSALESERFIERRDGPLIRRTVTYAWQH